MNLLYNFTILQVVAPTSRYLKHTPKHWSHDKSNDPLVTQETPFGRKVIQRHLEKKTQNPMRNLEPAELEMNIYIYIPGTPKGC